MSATQSIDEADSNRLAASLLLLNKSICPSHDHSVIARLERLMQASILVSHCVHTRIVVIDSTSQISSPWNLNQRTTSCIYFPLSLSLFVIFPSWYISFHRRFGIRMSTEIVNCVAKAGLWLKALLFVVIVFVFIVVVVIVVWCDFRRWCDQYS